MLLQHISESGFFSAWTFSSYNSISLTKEHAKCESPILIMVMYDVVLEKLFDMFSSIYWRSCWTSENSFPTWGLEIYLFL